METHSFSDMSQLHWYSPWLCLSPASGDLCLSWSRGLAHTMPKPARRDRDRLLYSGSDFGELNCQIASWTSSVVRRGSKEVTRVEAPLLSLPDLLSRSSSGVRGCNEGKLQWL